MIQKKAIQSEREICKVCKKSYEILYQNQTCRGCLTVSFEKIVSFINYHRNNSHGVVSKS